MKNKLIVGGILGAVILVMTMGAIMMSENSQHREQEWNQSSLATDSRAHCGEKYKVVGNNECVLDPQFIKPNTVIIYDVSQNGGTRLAIAPHNMIMDLTGNNSVTFVNDATNSVNIFVSNGATAMPLFDDKDNILTFNNVKPSSQKILNINNTGYYQFLIQDSRHGRTGEVIAMSDETNSLPVGIKAKMAQSIVGRDFEKDVGLVSVGSGGAEPGITIGIHEKFQDMPDAEKFHYDKYKKMIPFDVPIWIEFTSPIILQTG